MATQRLAYRVNRSFVALRYNTETNSFVRFPEGAVLEILGPTYLDDAVVELIWENGRFLAFTSHVLENCITEPEKRTSHRFPIPLSCTYRTRRETWVSATVVNISSSGVLISAGDRLPIGRLIQVRVMWPVRLQNKIPMALWIVGKVVRCNKETLALKIEHYVYGLNPVEQSN